MAKVLLINPSMAEIYKKAKVESVIFNHPPLNLFTIAKPLDLDEDADLIVWTNHSPFSFIITAVYSVSDTDNTDYDLDECDYHDNTNNRATIVDPAITDDGTGLYYSADTGLTHEIDATHHVVFDNDDTDDPNFIQVTIEGYYNADVD